MSSLQVARLFLSWKDQTLVGSCILLSKFASHEASGSFQRRVFESLAVASEGAVLGTPSLQTASAKQDPNKGHRLMLGNQRCGDFYRHVLQAIGLLRPPQQAGFEPLFFLRRARCRGRRSFESDS